MNVGFKKLHPDAILPTYGHSITDAGLDLYALHDYNIWGEGFCIVETGVAWDGMSLVTETEKPVLIVQSRSGLAFNNGIEASNAGIVDASYTGMIKVKLYNNSDRHYHITKGDKIAQGIVFMIPILTPEEVTEIAETLRGKKGFGSSGVS